MATSLGYQINRNPIAQSFFVEEPTGIYVTKVDLFFKSRDTTGPVTLQIRPMVNGYPSTSEVIPQSTKYVNGSNINISADATSATAFEFEEPVYLRGLHDYAIVVTTNLPDYEIYIAQIDEFEVGTTAGRISRNPALGSLFYSANGGTFSAAQDQDLTFKIYRADFDPSLRGDVYLCNAEVPRKLLGINPIRTFGGSDTVRISDPGHGFVVNDPVTIRGLDSASSIGGIPTTDIMGTAKTISAIDWTGYEITAASSADSDAIDGGLNVTVTKNIPFSIYYNNTQVLVPEETRIRTAIKATGGKSPAGTETPYTKPTNYETAYYLDTVYTRKANVVANPEIEAAELGAGIKSLEQLMYFDTASEYVTPMLDMQRMSMTLIDPQIDNQDSASTNGFNVPLNWVSEEQPFNGSAAAKHITSRIQLVEPAVGLKVIHAAFRPPGTNLKLYYRTAEEGIDIRTVNWTYQATSSNNPVDDEVRFREYQYLAGGQGGDLKEFTQFQVKIVFTSTSKRVPVVKDLRVIALSV